MTAFDDIPELIEPVKVTIQRKDDSKTQFSAGISGRHEVINHIERLPDIQLDAQIAFSNTQMKSTFEQVGAFENADGYCVFRYIDIQNAGIELKRGDKISKIGQLDVEYYFLHTTGDPAAHFSSQNFTLVRMFFANRVEG